MVTLHLLNISNYFYDQITIQSQQYKMIFPHCTPYGDIPSYPILELTNVVTPFPDINREPFFENINAMFTSFGFTDMNENQINVLLNEILMDLGILYPTHESANDIYTLISVLVGLASNLPVTYFSDIITFQQIITWAGIGNCFTPFQRKQIILNSIDNITGSPPDWYLILRSLSWYWSSYTDTNNITTQTFLPPDGWRTLVLLSNQIGCRSEFAKLSNLSLFTDGQPPAILYVAITNAILIYNILLLYPTILVVNNNVQDSINGLIASINMGRSGVLKYQIYVPVVFYATNMLIIPDVSCNTLVKKRT
jgi:hypothetical protein